MQSVSARPSYNIPAAGTGAAAGAITPVWASAVNMPALLNGPIEAGLAAAGNDSADAKQALHVYPDISECMLHTEMPAGMTNAEQVLYQDITFYVLACGLYLHGHDVDGNAIVHAAAATGAPPAKNLGIDQSWVDGLTKERLSRAAGAVMSTKVNLWLLNHHTGQGAIAGYAAKMVTTLLGARPSQVFVNAIWRAGHWVSTRMALYVLGVKNITPPTARSADINADAKMWPVPTDDVRIRIRSGPAGTARTMTCRAILKHALMSAYGRLLPQDAAWAALAAISEVQDDAVHHIGAQYLAGVAKVALMDVSDEVVEILSAYIHAVSPSGTLAKAKVISPVGAVSGHDVYTRIVAVKAHFVRMAAEDRSRCIVQLAMGKVDANDPLAAAAAAMKLPARTVITDQAISAAMAQSKAQAAQQSGTAPTVATPAVAVAAPVAPTVAPSTATAPGGSAP